MCHAGRLTASPRARRQALQLLIAPNPEIFRQGVEDKNNDTNDTSCRNGRLLPYKSAMSTNHTTADMSDSAGKKMDLLPILIIPGEK